MLRGPSLQHISSLYLLQVGLSGSDSKKTVSGGKGGGRSGQREGASPHMDPRTHPVALDLTRPLGLSCHLPFPAVGYESAQESGSLGGHGSGS